jgi:hypothetical protein
MSGAKLPVWRFCYKLLVFKTALSRCCLLPKSTPALAYLTTRQRRATGACGREFGPTQGAVIGEGDTYQCGVECTEGRQESEVVETVLSKGHIAIDFVETEEHISSV